MSQCVCVCVNVCVRVCACVRECVCVWQLRSVDLDWNRLEELPSWLGELSELSVVCASYETPSPGGRAFVV